MPPIRRVRQHVNPLSHKYATPALAPDWSKVFTNPQLPLHLDIGCAKGDFVREMAHKVPDWNFLGLEIRAPLVEKALTRRDLDRQGNLHFVFCNANNSLRSLLESYPSALRCVSIQFPDPWFKKRHQKRRVVQPELVNVIADLMVVGGKVWLQSDIEEVCQEMCDRFAENASFERSYRGVFEQPANQWLGASPFPAKTDREQVSEEKGLPVYRAMYFRRDLP
ncbi:tRNA (guanosine(46)-N7)-methyltransferase TrmB [Synechococcus sp. PCC 7335]|uniref:tRNA (guanosine(46)-N7)-methyltransferase TrmB n=1 Tax=Synechococcus sp. (strain ATCC 29403 / PCC 7335) TaxID=91464 RepID=UPI0002EBF28B|nr:tRNA (guanosine(46)-N7)-methyltransferase TrmB [Synechococcus sp. PCC 7335]